MALDEAEEVLHWSHFKLIRAEINYIDPQPLKNITDLSTAVVGGVVEEQNTSSPPSGVRRVQPASQFYKEEGDRLGVSDALVGRHHGSAVAECSSDQINLAQAHSVGGEQPSAHSYPSALAIVRVSQDRLVHVDQRLARRQRFYEGLCSCLALKLPL